MLSLSYFVVQGFIANITDRGCFVRFLGRLTGLSSIPQVLHVLHFKLCRLKSLVKDENKY